MGRHDLDDPVAVYIREVSGIEPLTMDEETKLFQELRQGKGTKESEIVAQRLVENRLALVVAIAEKHSASGVPMLDLIQEGNVGLMNAVRGFAEKPIGDFGAYAAPRIEDAISKAFGRSK